MRSFLVENDIIGITGDVNEVGTRKVGSVNVHYDTLVGLLGEPEDFSRDESSDVNLQWVFGIQYRDILDDYESDEHDVEPITIYDRRYDFEQEKDQDPRGIRQWTVGAKDHNGYGLLLNLLRNTA